MIPASCAATSRRSSILIRRRPMRKYATRSAQFVRKLSGFTKPSKANAAAFDRAVDDVTVVARRLIDSLVTTAAPRDREGFAERARVRAQARFGV